MSHREPISLEKIYQRDAVGLGVSYELFEKVLNMLGHAYRIDPKLLRPSDSLKKLYDLDSWNLGKGTDQLNERVIDDFGITRFEVEPRTIAELIVEIAKRQSRV